MLTREQLEERLASLHRASLELVQDISLESLLERIAIIACEQVGARYAAVGVLNEAGELEQFIPIGMTPSEIRKLPHQPEGKGLIGVLMNSRQAIRLPDVNQDARRAGFPAFHPVMNTFLGVPILLGEKQLGQIYLTNKLDATEFNADDEQVITTLAAYAAVAISNARLYRTLRDREQALTRRNEDLALLNNLASMLASSMDEETILRTALSRLVEYLGLEAGEIFLRNETNAGLDCVLHIGNSLKQIWTRTYFRAGEGLVGKVALSGQPELIMLSGQQRRFVPAAALRACIRQIVAVPITASGGVMGVLCIASYAPQPFDEMDMQLLTSIGSWTGTAVENARLSIQGRRVAILEERERIGMDLHDGVIQSIYAVGLTLEHARLLLPEDKELGAQKIEMGIKGLNHTIQDIRNYILDLRPRQLNEEEDLLGGLQRLVNELRANSSLDVSLMGSSEGLDQLEEACAIAMFHICQEALANISKHAQATRVEVLLWSSADRVLMEISDDGRGFDMAKAREKSGHGLRNIHTRARGVGGDVEITTAPGEGTIILAWVPFKRKK
ncbi:MAG TPA: GAF domain-containing sensor histidine kinase [Anaerolineaceae bacterium]|nr:GAF domain-containing sensor histidine kinase [Anaerolineaceae bacterium]HPN52229.1 GAF domain-containing sensor histidine kinase [Anaerolineaceae bacterium]